VDAGGNIYIADTGNRALRLVTPGGRISTIAGNGMPGYSGDGGLAALARLAGPSAVSVDSAGNIYVADGSTRVREIVRQTGVINTIAGNGTTGYSGDGGPAVNAQINTPMSAALDSAGNLYLADSANNAVRMLHFAGAPLSIGAVANAASNATGAVSPGELVVIYGSGLGPGALAQFQPGSNGLVPTLVGGTSVLFNGTAGPVLYSSATQVAAIVPFGITGPTVAVTVVYQGQSSTAASVNMAATAPAIFTANSSGTGPAAALNIPGGVNSASNPANGGSVVSLYITGGGQTNPPSVDGMPGGDGSSGNPFSLPLAPVTVTIGGKPATVQFAGDAPGVVAGVMQVNAVVPSGLAAGPAPVVVQVGGASSPGGVTIAVSGK